MSEKLVEWMNLGMVATLLVLLQLLSVYFLWALNPLSQTSEARFALFLAVDLVSFSIISYVYRVDKRGDGVNGGLLLAGCGIALLLMFTVLFV